MKLRATLIDEVIRGKFMEKKFVKILEIFFCVKKQSFFVTIREQKKINWPKVNLFGKS